MRLLTLIIFLGLATKVDAATYFLLSQTNTFVAGITNLAKAYTDAQIAAHGAIPGTVINTQGGSAGVPLALRDATGTNAAPFYGGEPVTSKTASYTILYTDNDTFFVWNSATNCIVTFNDGATNGFNVTFKNLGAGSLIITNAAGKTFDSQTSVTLPTSTISHWIADGTNYRGGRNGPNNLVSGNKVFASPSDGSSGLMVPRSLVAADLPTLTTAANWTASGSTNSLLSGTYFVNSGVVTNTLNIGGVLTATNAVLVTPNIGVAAGTRVGIGVAANAQTRLQVAGSGVFTDGAPDPGDGTPAGTRIGFDTGGAVGYIQAMQSGVSYNQLKLQPNGGDVWIGKALTIAAAANTTALTSTGYSLTGSDAHSLIDLSGTWNTSGVATLLKANVTNTASGAGSLLMDFQVGGLSRFQLPPNGSPLIYGASGASPNYRVRIDGDTGTRAGLGLNSSNESQLTFGPGGVSSPDIFLLRDGAANTLAMRNSTAAQTNRIYGTFSTTADYVRLAKWANSTTVNIAAETAGTGADNIPINITPAGTSGVVIGGVSDASAAAAGKVGEVISSNIAVGSAVSLTTATAANVTSISLTAGDWRVSGNVNFAATTATVTGTSGGITVTSATVPVDGTEVYSGVQVTLLSETDSVTLPGKQINVNATTTVYLVGKSTFSAGSVAAFGSISARRIR